MGWLTPKDNEGAELAPRVGKGIGETRPGQVDQ
jgi:hypothetical protein